MCKVLGWVGVGVKPIRACLCLWSQRPSLLWCSPAGAVNAPHDSGMCWKQFMMCLEDTWFVAAFHSTPMMHDPGLKEFQRPARVCVCKGSSVLPCLLSCCCWRRRPPAVRRSRLRAAPPPDACPPELPWIRHGLRDGGAVDVRRRVRQSSGVDHSRRDGDAVRNL